MRERHCGAHSGRGGQPPPPAWQAARIAKTHRHDGDLRLVVKNLSRHAQPIAQTIAGRIVERQAGFVDLGARRLATDQQPRGATGAQNRARPQGQGVGAEPAGAHVRQQRFE